MLLDVCFGMRTSWKILFVLGEAPGKAVSRKEIQQLTKLGNKVLTKVLLLFERFDVITCQRIGKTYNYKLNLSNSITEKMLEIIQLEKIALNNPDFKILNILREFVYELTNVNLKNLEKVILFGSYAKRTFTSNSDLDMAIVLKEKDANDELLITDISGRLNKRFGKEIQPHYYTVKEFDELRTKDRLVQEIIKDGIILM